MNIVPSLYPCVQWLDHSDYDVGMDSRYKHPDDEDTHLVDDAMSCVETRPV